jgi:putative nucleotidyltransferase with HDIG domain
LKTYLLIPLLEVIFGLALIVVLMIRGQRHAARKPFLFFLVFLTLWGFFTFMTRFTAGTGAALMWEKLVFASLMVAAMLFYWSTVLITGTWPKRNFLYGMLSVYILVLALMPTGLVVSDIKGVWYGEAPVIGPLFFLYLVSAYTPIVYSAVLLKRHSRQTRNVDERVRDHYFIMGIIAIFIGATTDYLSVLGINIYPLGIIGNILFGILATAAMLKHSLPEMRVLLRNGVTLLLTSLLIFAIFGSLIYLMNYAFLDFMTPTGITLTVMIAFFAALIVPPVFSRLKNTVDRWFFRKRYGHIQTLKNFNREIGADLGLEQLSVALVTAVAHGMGSPGVYLLLPSPVNGNFTAFTYCGQKNRGRLYFAASSPLIVMMRQQDKIIDNTELDVIPSLASLAASERQVLENNRIELLVPLKNNARLAGILLLSGKTSCEPYSNEERRLLHMVSVDIAASIDNANLYESIRQNHSELEKAMDGVIHAVSLVVESRDPYTAGHQRRVAELGRSIANEMGLSEWQVMGVYVAGLLHDVGKVAVPSEILNKSGKINHYEYSIIKSHSQVGYEILQKINFPWPVTTAILQHHERLNGSGYPAGISGEEIILEARILGVADVVEAMSSHRPYRPALGLSRALKEIASKRGILYDPQVVDACLSLLAKDETAFDQIMAVATASQKHILATAMKGSR